MSETTATPQQLLEELLRRKQAKDSLVGYIAYLDLGFVPAAHHRLIIDHLEAVERGECRKLMIYMPPGSQIDIRQRTLRRVVSRPASRAFDNRGLAYRGARRTLREKGAQPRWFRGAS